MVPGVFRRWLVVFVSCWTLFACQRPYRVGDHVLVEWGEEKLLYGAFIIDKRDETHFRVHFEGYPARWDEDVTLDRIKGLAPDHVTPLPPPRHVQVAQGIQKKPDEAALLSRYKVGDRLRVRWRDSVYRVVVVEVIGPGRLKIHYEGYEDAWDEVIDLSRVEADAPL